MRATAGDPESPQCRVIVLRLRVTEPVLDLNRDHAEQARGVLVMGDNDPRKLGGQRDSVIASVVTKWSFQPWDQPCQPDLVRRASVSIEVRGMILAAWSCLCQMPLFNYGVIRNS